MHKSKLTMITFGAIGAFATLLPWRSIQGQYMGVKLDADQKGVDHWPGWVALVLIALIVLFSILGKKDEAIKKGIPKMTILILSGLALLFALFLEGAYLMNEFDSPSYGLHIFAFAASGLLIAPFLYKTDGTVTVPTPKEVIEDVEENADLAEDTIEDFTDKIEDFTDKIEDKIEDRFDKDDDDEDEKKEAKKSDEKTSEDGKSDQ